MKSVATLGLKITLGLISIAALTACGFNPNSGSASPDYTSGAQSSSSSAANNVAECNMFSSSGGATLNGRITDYYYNGSLQSDRIRLRVTGIDAQFTSNADVNFQVFRFRADTNGNLIVDPTPLSFQFEQGISATSAFSPSVNVLNVSMLTQFNALGINATTVQGFFNATTMVVTGLDTTWQGVRIELISSGTVISQVDSLIPEFAANPNEYATSHPASLQALHPFWSMRAQSATDSAWVSLDNTYCF